MSLLSIIPLPYRILALALFAIALMGFGYVHGLHAGEAKLDAYKVAQEAATIKEQAAAAAKTRAMQAQKDEALNAATIRAQANARAAADARTELDGVRDDLRLAHSKLSSASLETARQYAAAAGAVFGECAAALEGMARAAGGHASDALMFEQAWPQQGEK